MVLDFCVVMHHFSLQAPRHMCRNVDGFTSTEVAHLRNSSSAGGLIINTVNDKMWQPVAVLDGRWWSAKVEFISFRSVVSFISYIV